MYARVLGGGVVLGLGVLLLAAPGSAADDNKGSKAAAEAVLKLCEAYQKNSAEDVKKNVEALKKHDLIDIMTTLKRKDADPPGIGMRNAANANEGIEAKLITLSGPRALLTTEMLAKQGDDIAWAAYLMAGIAEVCKDKCTVDKKQGEKDPKDWKQWMEDMHKEALNLAKVAKEKKDPKAVQLAALNLRKSCTACHSAFRD